MTESEAKQKAMAILKPVEARLYTSEWRSLMMAIQDELTKSFNAGLEEGATIVTMLEKFNPGMIRGKKQTNISL